MPNQEDARISKQQVIRELLIKLIDAGSALVIIYLTINPRALDDLAERAMSEWERLRHSFSVGQAIRAIRRLPETEVTKVTDTKGEK